MVSGERFNPEEHDILIKLEHWHRYLHILDIVEDKVVLDIASGTGYGTNLLAKKAKYITGVDICEESIFNSKKKYIQDNLNYLVGSVNKIPLADKSIDVIISFETIEHVSENLQYQFLNEVKRVIKDNGIFIVSTPEKHYYSDIRNYHNEFHIKEFYEKEFYDFLKNSFTHVQFNYQTTLIGSNIFKSIDEEIHKKYSFNVSKNVSKEYMIAYCSNQGELKIPRTSINLDYENTFFHNLNIQVSELWKRIKESESQLEKTEETNKELWKRIEVSEKDNEEKNTILNELWKRVEIAEKNFNELERNSIKNRLKRIIKHD